MLSHTKKYFFYVHLFLMPFYSYGIISLPELLGLGKNKPPQSEKSIRSIRAHIRKNKKPYQTIKTMSYDQLYDYRASLLSGDKWGSSVTGTNPRLIPRRKVCKEKSDLRAQLRNKERAIKYTERMIPLCKDLELIGKHMLELADLNFDCGNLEEAQKKYKEFVLLYPGDEKLHHALHKELLSSFYLSLDPERDQEKTHETVKIAETFLTRATADSSYYTEVLSIKKQCEERLFEKELLIAQFYLKQRSFSSVYTRIKTTKSAYQKFMEQSPQSAEKLAQLESQLISIAPGFASLLKKDAAPAQEPTSTGQITQMPALSNLVTE